MADEFDEELQKEPEGSIITPIFLGCGAMGLGCLFSLGAIVIGLLIFFPGIWNAVLSVGSAPMRAEALPLVEANPAVVAALGTPIEAELDDVDDTGNADNLNLEVGGDVELNVHYILTGPDGSGTMDVVGSRDFSKDEEWTVTSVRVTLQDGQQINVFPGDDAALPPTPAAPPAVETNDAAPETLEETPDGAIDEVSSEPETTSEDMAPEEEPAN